MQLKSACQNILEKNKDVLTIILTGSRARGDFKEESDYDLMFITRKGKKYSLENKYRSAILKKANIDASVHLWPFSSYKKEYEKGNSFIYCALRDGKILSSRHNLNEVLPDCKKAGVERINLAKRNLEYLNFKSKFNRKLRFKENRIWGFELEELGYTSMHLCWGICMLNRFCPISKYTALNESKKFFSEKEFKAIKKSYRFYSHPDFLKKINKKTFTNLHKSLNLIVRRIKRKHNIE